jgi:hypothetical protein
MSQLDERSINIYNNGQDSAELAVGLDCYLVTREADRSRSAEPYVCHVPAQNSWEAQTIVFAR